MQTSTQGTIPNLLPRSISSVKTVVILLALAVAVIGFWFREPISSFVKNQLTILEIRQRVLTEDEAVIAVVDQASPAVVSVLASRVVEDPFSGPISQKQGIGTGFIIRENGLILTNRHVVSDTAIQYSVVTKDGTEYAAQEIHRDTLYDLAIIKINASGLPTVSLGDSDQLKIGQTAVAIGNALGEFSNSVTKGIISGVGRRVGDLEDVIQTDASINPGNSGGPLLNLASEVIGINVAIIAGGENIGFAIPANLIKPVVEQFEAAGKIIRPFLGVNYYLYTEDEAKLRGLSPGAFVISVVKNSGAEAAGVKAGDVITAIDGQKLVEERSLAKIIAGHKIGDTVVLTVIRDEATLTLSATLGASPGN